MRVLFDTNIAIHIRDGDDLTDRLNTITAASLLVVSRVELENGVYRSIEGTIERRRRLDVMVHGMTTLPFGDAELATYRAIVERIGYVRSRVFDRMIAATALVHDLPLVTINGRDFVDVPGLKLEVWSSPS